MKILIVLILSVLVVAIALPLLEFLLLMTGSYTLKQITLPSCISFIREFLQARAERRVLCTYMSMMTSVIGFPFGVDLAIQYVSEKDSVSIELKPLDEYSLWLSLGVGVLITIGYALYIYNLVNKNKASYTTEIIKALAIINEQYDFAPNQEWLNTEATKALKALGRRYDKKHNIQHPQLSFILAVLNRDISSVVQWKDDIETLINQVYELIPKLRKEEQETIRSHISVLIEIVNHDKWGEEEVRTFKTAVECISSLLNTWHETMPYEKRSGVAYDWSNYQPIISKFLDYVGNPWMECMYKQVMVVSGQGGMGKSHLLGNIVDERIKDNHPTILLLGERFNGDVDPWNQVLSLLDIKCKKETFLNGLDAYAGAQGERIQIIIDAINEGGGKEYWAKHISHFVSDVSAYEHIGVVLSIRTTNTKSRLDEYISDTSHASYEVPGFTENLTQASEYMFDSFGLTTPSWSVIDGMFANPMWLHMYCVSHERLGGKSERENHWQIVEHYIEGFEKELAAKFQYSEEIKLLQTSLILIADRMITEKKLVSLPYQEAYESVYASVEHYIKEPSEFFNELLEIGILRQSSYRDEAVIHFEYEMFGRYIIAYRLASEYPQKQWNEYVYLFRDELTEVVPLVKGQELFTLTTNESVRRLLEDAFFTTLQYRTTLTDSGNELLEKVKQEKEYEILFDAISKCATNSQIRFNAGILFELMCDMPMMERDALWTVRISEWSELRDRLMDYARWAMEVNHDTLDALDKKVAELLGETLIWSLCSTQGKLRDTATKGLVNLLINRQELLMSLLEKYHDVSDLYITERLWGVAFGCCTQNGDIGYVESVAVLAREYVFEKEQVVEHILITDYTRLIIEYAISLGSMSLEGYRKHKPPYNTYKKIPLCSDAYVVKNYEKPYENHKDEKVTYSVHKLLGSMAVEYSRKGVGGYGDFGRYTFQATLSMFPENPNGLSNWGVKMIFKDFGYNPEMVKWFDSQAAHYGSYDWERIGKKYQWLALYRIAAILSDFHAKDAPKENDKVCVYGIRNIDPTVLKVDTMKVKELNGKRHTLPAYGYEQIDNEIWMQSPKHMPKIEGLVRQKTGDGSKWVTLYAYNEYTIRPDKLSRGKLNREFWCFMQSCFVDKSKVYKAMKIIDKRGIAGRSFTENREVYHMYAGEWYWSDDYKENVVDIGYEERPLAISMDEYKDIMIRPTMIDYTHECHYDMSQEDGDTIYFPNSQIVKTLNLRLSDGRGIWVNEKGEVVLFDNAVTGGKSALMIREDTLLEYLQKTDQVIIWPLLIEKRVKRWQNQCGDNSYRYLQSGGYVMMDAKGRIKHKIRQYEKIYLSRYEKWAKMYIKPSMEKIKHGLREVGIKLHIVKLSEEELMEYMLRSVLKKDSKRRPKPKKDKIQASNNLTANGRT